MICLVAFTVFFQSLYACPSICNNCSDTSYCQSCLSGFFLQSGICSSCPAHCSSCLNTSYCKTCYTGFGLKYNHQSCQRCISNCDSCDNYYGCQTCSSGYSYDQEYQECYKSEYTGPIIIGSIVGLIIIVTVICIIKDKCQKIQIPPINNDAGGTQNNIYNNRYPAASFRQWQNLKQNQQFRHFKTCTICLSQQLNVETQCGHGFHIQCLNEWFNKDPICPNCRAPIGNVLLFCNICYRRYKQLNLKSAIEGQQFDTACNVCTQILQ